MTATVGEDPRTAAVAASLERWVARDAVPGVQYVAVTADALRCEIAVGMAARRHARPMESATTMMAYSMSKTITAVAALQLVDAGRLALDQPLGEATPYGPDVTLRQLLSHTAGAPAPLPLRWVHPALAHDGFDERAALGRVLQRHRHAASAAGQRFRYSNIGYWLVGRLIEQASGVPFMRYVEEQVIARLGLTPASLGFRVTNSERHAAGYLERFSMLNALSPFVIDRALIGEAEGRWVQIHDHYVDGPAFGGLVGTATAFGRFLQDQLSPRSLLLGEEMRRLLVRPQTTRNGRAVPMTLGWHVERHQGDLRFYKEGGGGGFHCMMRLYPRAGLGTVLMCNATGFDVRRALDAADGALLG